MKQKFGKSSKPDSGVVCAKQKHDASSKRPRYAKSENKVFSWQPKCVFAQVSGKEFLVMFNEKKKRVMKKTTNQEYELKQGSYQIKYFCRKSTKKWNIFFFLSIQLNTSLKTCLNISCWVVNVRKSFMITQNQCCSSPNRKTWCLCVIGTFRMQKNQNTGRPHNINSGTSLW